MNVKNSEKYRSSRIASPIAWTRRAWLKANSRVALAAAVTPMAWRSLGRSQRHDPARTGPMALRDPKIKALAHDALDAARQAGARYADVRITYTKSRTYEGGGTPEERSFLGWSVRALVDGYWGWAARPDLTTEAGPWLGREAVRLARANAASGPPRTVELGTIPAVENGEWTSPIKIDPFEVPLQEITDWLDGLLSYFQRMANRAGENQPFGSYKVVFTKQERLFASTEGSLITQTVYNTAPSMSVRMFGSLSGLEPAARAYNTQVGWECLSDVQMDVYVEKAIDAAKSERTGGKLPVKPFDVGRYDVILSASSMAAVLNKTLGYATELDRALGYEANAGGTSYLGPDPMTYLGTPIASPLVTVTANRTTPKELATVQWDDEGVRTEEFTLVKDGVLMDYQTTREQAAWLAPWYAKQGKAIRSHGCAAASSALEQPMQHQPNLMLHPGADELSVGDMVEGMAHGLLIDFSNIRMDFQALNGIVYVDSAIEVRNGLQVAVRRGKMALLFRAPEFWRDVIALGGPQTLEWMRNGESEKGEPSQTTQCSLAAVPAMIKQQTITDDVRKSG